MLVFDIETGARDDALDGFDPAAVKFGNTKDIEKRLAKIEEAEDKYLAQAALKAESGRILAIGIRDPAVDGCSIVTVDDMTEPKMAQWFWGSVQSELPTPAGKVVGFNSHGFDIPFLVRRSFMLGVEVPREIFRGRYLCPQFIDLMEVWQCGNRQDYIGLEKLSLLLDGPEKLEDVTGKDFDQLLITDKDKALRYLERDLEMTLHVAEKLQV